MMPVPRSYWATLADSFAASLIDALAAKFRSPNPIFLTAAAVAAEVNVDEHVASAVLEQLAADGYVLAHDRWRCRNCSHELDHDQRAAHECPICQVQFDHSPPIAYKAYVRPGRASRDTRWVIAVHGMNTLGAWQQDFGWRLAKLYGYAVPLAIYKYGRVLFSPLLIIRQTRLRDDLVDKIQSLRTEMRAAGYGDRPDVIAHSFGTWLLSHALVSDPGILLGRVILTGSIVRPDFAWDAVIAAGQVEAVLCHYGRRDVPVRISQFMIPDSGPSGFRGFNDRQVVVHRVEPSFRHSDYFTRENLQEVMDTVWSLFLTLPHDQLFTIARVHDANAATWKPSRWRWLSHLLKYVVLLMLVTISLFLVVALVIGGRAIVESIL